MSKLFLFSLIEIFSRISLDLIVIISNSLIIVVSLICVILTVVKREYGVKNRLWTVFFMLGVWFIQLWIEVSLNGYVTHLYLTVGISMCALAIVLFLPQKSNQITEPQRNLARLISNSVKTERVENYENDLPERSTVFSSPIIKTEQKNETNNLIKKSEIDFSHVKSVLNKLEYYPLKEQDKKQAKELENAIINAEQNGINVELKEKINDGLGALLKIMSKYAI